MSDAKSSSATAEREAKVLAHAIELMYHRLGATQIHLFLMPAVFGYAYWGRVNQAILITWIIITSAVYAVRIAISVAYRNRSTPMEQAPRWGQYFTLTSILSGIVWGLAGILFFVPESAGHQVLLYTSIMGLAAGSLIVTAYWLPGFYGFAVPSISMGAARLAYEGTFEYQGLAVLMLMYLSIVVMVSRNQKTAAYDVINLRFENLELIDQLREQKKLAEQANIAKSKFLASASHDLRQPLHALGLFTTTLKTRLNHSEEIGLVENIGRSVTALEDLFNALLDISRLDAGIVRARFTHSNLLPILDRLSNEYAPQAYEKQLEWHVECNAVAAQTDPVLLETILRNLISNSIRYTNQGGIRIRCFEKSGYVNIVIEDTGVGIPVEYHHAVFDEFVQLQNPERDRTKGLGLGLSIVKRLCDLLQHPLEMQSQQGKGSVFSLQLISVQPLKESPIEETILPIVSGNGVRVLVIDDETVVRSAMQSLLVEWGYDVLVVESLQESIEKAKNMPEVIITDYRLRGNQTGVEAIHELHKHWNKKIPALIVTGEIGAEQLRDVNQSSFSLLHKPVQPGRLRAFLRQVTLNGD